jgi:tetratricopeptide (TPR) repeat protein
LNGLLQNLINGFYRWMGSYNVSLAFVIALMYAMALYMLFRNLRRMTFLAVLTFVLQGVLVTMATLVLVDKVLVIPAYEALFILGGFLLPLLFLLADFFGLKRRARVGGRKLPLVAKPERKPGIVLDEDWMTRTDAPGSLYPAGAIVLRLQSPDADVLARAGEQLREAERLVEAQDLDGADAIYSSLTSLIALDARGFCNAGWLKHRAGDQEEAIHLFKRALAQARREARLAEGGEAGHDPDWFARYGLACAQFALSEWEEALFGFQKAAVRGERSAGLLLNMARCHLQLDYPELAREELEQALTLEDNPDTRLALARLFLQLSLREGAVAQLEHITYQAHDMPEAWRMLGTLYRKEENWLKAEHCFVQLVKLEPENADAWFRLGTCRRHLERYDEALQGFEAAIRLKPDHSRAFYGAAAIHEERGHDREAERLLKQALVGDEPMEKSYNLLAAIYEKEGKTREAVAVYLEAVAQFPDDALLHANLGAAQLLAGFHERAVKPLKTAIRLGENDPVVYTQCANALFELKHYHEAVRLLRDGMAAWPEDAGLKYLSARAKAHGNDTTGAISDLEAAVALSPSLRLDARACMDFAGIRTAPGFIDLIRLPAKKG